MACGLGVWEGTDEGTDKAGLVIKKFNNWTSIYVSVPPLPQDLLKNIAKYAGVHIYNDAGDVLYASKHYLGLVTGTGGERVIELPRTTDVYDVFEDQKITEGVNRFAVTLPRNSVVLYCLSD